MVQQKAEILLLYNKKNAEIDQQEEGNKQNINEATIKYIPRN